MGHASQETRITITMSRYTYGIPVYKHKGDIKSYMLYEVIMLVKKGMKKAPGQ
jgi:hypothetical protein